mmetsp:Transcript_3127/g.3734  ORF Transcript_3127/g.3734 Transcript_3127/m.3734 type:complete len:134 (+) Transcript_3127:8-409(+)
MSQPPQMYAAQPVDHNMMQSQAQPEMNNPNNQYTELVVINQPALMMSPAQMMNPAQNFATNTVDLTPEKIFDQTKAPHSLSIMCHKCKQNGQSRVVKKVTRAQYTICIILFFLFFICCLLPFCIPACYKYEHY